MTTNHHTAIATGAAANAATFNSPLAELDAVLTNVQGGASVIAGILTGWTESESWEATSLTYDGTYTSVVASATVKWPDGSAGTLTATSINATWYAIDAYTITHTASSQTVTQAAVTRNSDGSVTTKPALTVA